jgi:hypothetical protein
MVQLTISEGILQLQTRKIFLDRLVFNLLFVLQYNTLKHLLLVLLFFFLRLCLTSESRVDRNVDVSDLSHRLAEKHESLGYEGTCSFLPFGLNKTANFIVESLGLEVSSSSEPLALFSDSEVLVWLANSPLIVALYLSPQ